MNTNKLSQFLDNLENNEKSLKKQLFFYLFWCCVLALFGWEMLLLLYIFH